MDLTEIVTATALVGGVINLAVSQNRYKEDVGAGRTKPNRLTAVGYFLNLAGNFVYFVKK
jgi:hypothetical protein